VMQDLVAGMSGRIVSKMGPVMDASDDRIIAALRARGDPRAAPAAVASRGKGGKAGPPQGGPKIKTIDNSRFAPAPVPEGGGGSAMDALVAEINGIGTGGAKSLGLAHTKKNQPHTREKVDSRSKSGSKFTGGKKKVVFPVFEGYQGNDLYRIAYLIGDRSSKERRTVTLENPRREAVQIMECEDVDITIEGVAKNISIAGCKRYKITCDGSIGQLEVSNSSSGYLSVKGKIYQLTCDKCDSLEATLCPEAYGADIVTAQCSSVNIGLDNPDDEAEVEFLTLPIPSQYKSVLVFDGKKVDIHTEAVSHNFG